MADNFYTNSSDEILVNTNDEPIDCAACPPCDLVCPEIANEGQEQSLHARLRVGSNVTHLPNVVWDTVNTQWTWSAGVPANRICMTGSGNTNPSVNQDVVDAVTLDCGDADSGTNTWPPAGMNFRNTAGTFLTPSSTTLASSYDPGPGSFLITYNFGNANTNGVTFAGPLDDLELEFYDDFYLP